MLSLFVSTFCPSRLRITECGAELARFEAGLFAEEPTEIRRIGKAQVASDLLDIKAGVRQLPLRFADDACIDDCAR